MLGSVVGGFLLRWLANATISGGLETIVYIVLLIYSGVWGGAVGGVWIALSLKHAPRVARTVTLFASVPLLAIVPLLLVVGQFMRLLPFGVFPEPSGTLQGTVPLALGIGAIAAGVRHISMRSFGNSDSDRLDTTP
jgi:branched-subunit amino acid transport protein AzlD